MASVRAFLGGVGFFVQGLRWMARHPGSWLFGLLPAVVTAVLYIGVLIFLGTRADDISAYFTPFADDWNAALRNTMRAVIAIVVFGAGLAVAVLTFTPITLTIGDPFYQKLSERVEESYGEVPEGIDESLWRSIVRSVKDSLATLGYALLFTVPLFFLGFVPGVGQTVVPVLGALVSGFFLTAELTTLAMERRGILRKERFAILRANKATAVGFGVVTFLIFLVPLGAIIAMPVAVAGAAIMVRLNLAAASEGTAAPDARVG
ncbi:EI24 domain-containing protein [Thermostaphylospora chromogena]|uniref:CysZ protein n=1 Tax=Thermostaphylospora chromogena TaxID=35622 RepID=A0A1H1I4J2_9ACTN|nr:EI24 domain-containing protein [Thermostaphylospora chromogena]SDR32288.1 CysZ protein [Thermostaphylospora chromogena]